MPNCPPGLEVPAKALSLQNSDVCLWETLDVLLRGFPGPENFQSWERNKPQSFSLPANTEAGRPQRSEALFFGSELVFDPSQRNKS